MRHVLLTTILLACGGPTTAEVASENETPPLGCGDGVVEAGEDCDDGNAVGGDGCTEWCVSEAGALEVEPNDAWLSANPLDAATAHGTLPEGDVDCWSVDAPACAAITARLVGNCPADVTLGLFGPGGPGVASGGPGPDGCAVIDPYVSPGAASVQPGTQSVCVSSVLGLAVPSYALEIEVDPNGAGFSPQLDQDFDGDGTPDLCDEDLDGDGVDNLEDNCPSAPNGPDTEPPDTRNDGFIRHWLTLGPIIGTKSTGDCRPAEDEATGDDANAAPEAGQVDAALSWLVWYDEDDRINLRDRYGYVNPDREAYAHAYVYSDTERNAILAVGADDGVFAWFDGVQVLDVSSCQGTNIDDFQAPVTIPVGWSRLTLKVRDHGGGWGLYARFLDAVTQAPITDLEISLTASGSWSDDQLDSDGDGVGDACDDG